MYQSISDAVAEVVNGLMLDLQDPQVMDKIDGKLRDTPKGS